MNLARAAIESENGTGRLLSEAFMYRHNAQTHRLVELVRGGAIGELRVIRAAFSYGVYDADNIRLRTDVEGGSLMDVGCYCVSGSRLLAGEPESVYSYAYIGPSGTDWTFAGMMRFPRRRARLFDAHALAERDELEAIGTEGSLFLDDPWHCSEPVELRRNDGVERSDAIRGEAALLLGRDDAVAQARAIDALFRSAESGSGVALA